MFAIFIAEHLSHCSSRSDLIRCSSAWEYPEYVDSYVQLLFIYLKEEINTKK